MRSRCYIVNDSGAVSECVSEVSNTQDAEQQASCLFPSRWCLSTCRSLSLLLDSCNSSTYTNHRPIMATSDQFRWHRQRHWTFTIKVSTAAAIATIPTALQPAPMPAGMEEEGEDDNSLWGPQPSSQSNASHFAPTMVIRLLLSRILNTFEYTYSDFSEYSSVVGQCICAQYMRLV